MNAAWMDGACFECGGKDHSIKDCPQLTRILAAIGCKLPDNHESFFKKMAKQQREQQRGQPQQAAPVVIGQDEEGGTVANPVVPVWPVLNHVTFKDLDSLKDNNIEDPDEDDAAMAKQIAALQPSPALASPVTQGKPKMPPMPRKPQKTKSNKKPPPLTTEKIDNLIAQIEAGIVTLPKVADGKILSLVDNGAAPIIANLAKHFPGCVIRPSAGSKSGAQYQNANGKPFANRGEFNLPCRTNEGQSWDIIFQDADVSLPILSTGRLADAEYEIVYRKHDGEL